METTVVRKLKRSYTAAFKLKVVEHAKKKSKNDASLETRPVEEARMMLAKCFQLTEREYRN